MIIDTEPDTSHFIVVFAQDPRKLYWDLFVGIMIVYSMILIPWRIAFKQDATGAWLTFDYFVDGVFGADILLCFNTAYYEEVRYEKQSAPAVRYFLAAALLKYMQCLVFIARCYFVGMLVLSSACYSVWPVLVYKGSPPPPPPSVHAFDPSHMAFYTTRDHRGP